MDEIFKRGTCRHFKELTPVAKEDLLTLVKAGMQARACGNQEAREFIIVTRDDLVKAISHNSLVAGPARKAGAAIVIVGQKENISFPEECFLRRRRRKHSYRSRTSGSRINLAPGLSLCRPQSTPFKHP